MDVLTFSEKKKRRNPQGFEPINATKAEGSLHEDQLKNAHDGDHLLYADSILHSKKKRTCAR